MFRGWWWGILFACFTRRSTFLRKEAKKHFLLARWKQPLKDIISENRLLWTTLKSQMLKCFQTLSESHNPILTLFLLATNDTWVTLLWYFMEAKFHTHNPFSTLSWQLSLRHCVPIPNVLMPAVPGKFSRKRSLHFWAENAWATNWPCSTAAAELFLF